MQKSAWENLARTRICLLYRSPLDVASGALWRQPDCSSSVEKLLSHLLRVGVFTPDPCYQLVELDSQWQGEGTFQLTIHTR